MPSTHHQPPMGLSPGSTETSPPSGGSGRGGVRSRVRAMVDWLEKPNPTSSPSSPPPTNKPTSAALKGRKATPFAAAVSGAARNRHISAGDTVDTNTAAAAMTTSGKTDDQVRKLRAAPEELVARRQRSVDEDTAEREDSGLALRLYSCSSTSPTLRTVSSVYSQDGAQQAELGSLRCIEPPLTSPMNETSEDMKTPRPTNGGASPAITKEASRCSSAGERRGSLSMTTSQPETSTAHADYGLSRWVMEAEQCAVHGHATVPIDTYDATFEKDALEVLRYRQFFQQRLDRCLDMDDEIAQASLEGDGDMTSRGPEALCGSSLLEHSRNVRAHLWIGDDELDQYCTYGHEPGHHFYYCHGGDRKHSLDMATWKTTMTAADSGSRGD
ncbi:hypothetical protein Micbo1qcDRAFT_205017 [Microdochium bolleyi]|uniref:Uncharacterized protein n=1 Tax=Microdochium bolleyi TaxID=196109 RepID=A0A136J195_9PEZI|nr:hypothetical protein Micbo1qcDRAFT_205017 [Microdochium bolleyi]